MRSRADERLTDAPGWENAALSMFFEPIDSAWQMSGKLLVVVRCRIMLKINHLFEKVVNDESTVL